MNLVVAGMAGLGVWLIVTGIVSRRPARLAARVEPYISGLHGRPAEVAEGDQRWKQSLARSLRPILPTDFDSLARRLESAGSTQSAESFRIEQVTWGAVAISIAVASFVLAASGGIMLEPRALPVFALLAGVIGFLGRDWKLQRAIAARRDRLAEELPVAVDLLALTVMAGESVVGAFARVADTLEGGIGEEFRRVVADARAGEPMTDALESLSMRLEDPGIARLVDALCTGIERGTPLADVLRAQADDSRDARRRRLIETAGKKEVLMLVPVVFLIMPVVVVFALYPGLVSLQLLVP